MFVLNICIVLRKKHLICRHHSVMLNIRVRLYHTNSTSLLMNLSALHSSKHSKSPNIPYNILQWVWYSKRMSILYKKAQHYLFHGLSPESRSQTRWSCEDRVLHHGRSPSSSVHLQWVSWPWGPRSIYTFSWLSFQAKQKLNAINSKIPSTPEVMTFHNSDMKSPCLCRWGDYQNSARILRWYFGSWHCNYQCNTKYNTESDILMITLDATWKLKPIRYIIRR